MRMQLSYNELSFNEISYVTEYREIRYYIWHDTDMIRSISLYLILFIEFLNDEIFFFFVIHETS